MAVKRFHILAFGDHGTDAGFGVKAWNAGTTGPHPFGQGALGVEFKFQLAAQILPHEFGVFADVRAHHLLDLPGFEQQAKPEAINPRVIRCNRQPFWPRIPDRRDQKFGDTAEPEPACRNQHLVKQQAVQSRGRVWVDFLHAVSPPAM